MIPPFARFAQRVMLLPIACTLAIAILLISTPAWGLSAGDKAPVFTAPSLNGTGKLGLGDFRGKIVYVDFWASWCPPCLTSLPMLEELRKEFPGRDFQILAINIDKDPAKALKFLKKSPVGYPSVTDPSGKLPEAFGLETMPTSYLIDANGVVRHVNKGFRKTDIGELRQLIGDLLGAR